MARMKIPGSKWWDKKAKESDPRQWDIPPSASGAWDLPKYQPMKTFVNESIPPDTWGWLPTAGVSLSVESLQAARDRLLRGSGIEWRLANKVGQEIEASMKAKEIESGVNTAFKYALSESKFLQKKVLFSVETRINATSANRELEITVTAEVPGAQLPRLHQVVSVSQQEFIRSGDPAKFLAETARSLVQSVDSLLDGSMRAHGLNPENFMVERDSGSQGSAGQPPGMTAAMVSRAWEEYFAKNRGEATRGVTPRGETKKKPTEPTPEDPDVERALLSGRMGVAFEWHRWAEEIPWIQWPSRWLVQVVPPSACAIVRFKVRTRFMPKDRWVSVYLDGYNLIGAFGGPYWEAYPFGLQGGDIARFAMKDTGGLLGEIQNMIDALEVQE